MVGGVAIEDGSAARVSADPFDVAGSILQGVAVKWTSVPVLVTGGSGFLGQYVAKRLEELGAHVSVARQRDYDLTDPLAAKRLFQDVRPRRVIHLAARVGGIGANQRTPAEFIRDNMLMGLHTVHEAYEAGVERFVGVGTVCSYPKHCPVPFDEQSLWDGYPEETNAPYGIAKRSLIALASAYRQQHGFDAFVCIPTNLYGPRDNFAEETSHVIPAMIRKFVSARAAQLPAVMLWGDGTPTREFLYVDDAAHGICLLAETYRGTGPVNLGSGEEVSIADLARRVAERVGYVGRIEWDRNKPNGQPRRRVLSDKVRCLGFRPQVSLRDGLQRTIDWYLQQQDHHA